MVTIKIDIPDELIKLDNSEEDCPEIIRMYYLSDNDSVVYRDKNIRGRNVYNLYIPGHPVKQIFSMGVTMPVQQWDKGYFFISECFIDGDVYTIGDKSYRCSKVKSSVFGSSYIELVEVLDKAANKIDISSWGDKFIEVTKNYLAAAKEE